MNLFFKTPEHRFEKLFFNIYYTYFRSRIVLCIKKERSYCYYNTRSQIEITSSRKRKRLFAIPIFGVFTSIGCALIQNDIFFQFVLSTISLVILIISTSVKKYNYKILINENKIEYNKFELDFKFKNMEGITFFKLVKSS
jgi:hypothetical protein